MFSVKTIWQGIKKVLPSSDIIKEFLGIQDEIHIFYSLVYGFLSKNNELIKSRKMSNEELCDFGFLCREQEKIFDELRKEMKARKELCGQIIAYRLTQAAIQDPSIKMKVNGSLATGTPDLKMIAAIPKKLSAEYYQLTDYLSVPREVAATGILKLDWKTTMEFVTQLAQDGKKIPPGFGRQYPTYTTVYRKKRNK